MDTKNCPKQHNKHFLPEGQKKKPPKELDVGLRSLPYLLVSRQQEYCPAVLSCPVLFCSCSCMYVTLRVPPLASERGWTGELWSNCVLLILEKKTAFFFFLNIWDFLKFEIYSPFLGHFTLFFYLFILGFFLPRLLLKVTDVSSWHWLSSPLCIVCLSMMYGIGLGMGGGGGYY